jgi:hypothetical protein
MTRLEYFAAAALTGLMGNDAYFGTPAEIKAELAVEHAIALADEIDSLFAPDCTDPDLIEKER